MRRLAGALAVGAGIFVAWPVGASAQGQFVPYVYQYGARAYPYVNRWVQSPTMPYTVHRFYQGGRTYFGPRQYYYPPPQYRMHGTTPYMMRRY
jgi:hypothetical protein